MKAREFWVTLLKDKLYIRILKDMTRQKKVRKVESKILRNVKHYLKMNPRKNKQNDVYE